MRRTGAFSRIAVPAWVLAFLPCATALLAQTALPSGAQTLINEDRYGRYIALCAETGDPVIHQGPKTVRSTAVWAGERSALRRLDAGIGACDPAWSPDGRRLAVTSAEGLWVVAAGAAEGSLRVESRPPVGELSGSAYRAFTRPRWSPDGRLVALRVTNGAMAWVEVFEASTGRLFYTSPPGDHSYSWSAGGRALKLGSTEIRLSFHR